MLDAGRVLRDVGDVRDRSVDPSRRELLDRLIVHMRTETVDVDHDAFSATVSDDVEYLFRGSSPDGIDLAGRAAVEDYMERFLRVAGTDVEYAMRRIVVDERCVAMDGVVRRVVDRAVLDEGLVHLDTLSTGDDTALLESRMAVFYRFDDDLAICGKDMFASRVPGPVAPPPPPVERDPVAVDLDSTLVLTVLDEHAARLDPDRVRLLDALRAHMVAEAIDLDADALVRGMTEDATIGTWGSSRANHGMAGRAAIHEHFTAEFAEPWAAQVEYRPEVVAVDARAVALRGRILRRFPGALLASQEFVPHADRDYLWDTSMAVVYSFDTESRIRSIDTFPSGEIWTRLHPVA